MVGPPEHWEKVKEIVGGALEREPDQRSAFLDLACAQNPSLRSEVDSLLSAHAKAGDLSNPPWTEQFDQGPLEGQFVGPYRLAKKLGEGGMGQVWLAVQTSPVRRQVALKLIRGGLFHSIVLQRFQAERQSLAIMDHPTIAKVFDAGATPHGQPYFVMEYVEGLPISAYCDQKKLPIRDRLRLFIQVCEGVQHAHQKAIIHRDLKPANILVVEVDGKPVPRIIDFGLAKVVAPPEPGETLFTQVGAFLGTPGYASPEQTDPTIQDIDTRTDVYSLGVVLYELLTGAMPFDSQQLRKQPLDKLLRILREEDPPSPSTKVSADREASASHAESRGTDSVQLATLLRGDLDWVTMKALERDRNRRYGSPSDLAADIERYLENRPIVARPASTGYRFRKYVRRNRVAVSVTSGVLVLLIAFTFMQAIQLRRITRERDRANRVTDFMTSMFKVSDPSEARGNSITAREILDKSSKEIEAGLAKDPELQARLMGTMGGVYSSLGLYAEAQPLLAKALDTRLRILGTEHPDTLRSMDQLGRNLERQGHYAEAKKLVRETLDARLRVLSPEDPEVLSSMHRLAALMLDEGQFVEAEKLNRQVFETSRRVLGPEHPDTLGSMNNLALSLGDQGRDPEAEKLYRQSFDIQRRLLGPDHPATLVTETTLARSLSAQGKYAEADQLLRETLETKRRVLGPEHSETLWSMHDLGINLRSSGRLPEAEKIDRETLEIRRRVLGVDHPETLMSMGELAETLDDMHHYPEAEALYREALAIQLRVLGPDHPGLALTRYNLACNLALTGRRDESLVLLRESVDHGFNPAYAANMEHDSDLNSLHDDPRFTELIAYVHQRIAAAQKQK